MCFSQDLVTSVGVGQCGLEGDKHGGLLGVEGFIAGRCEITPRGILTAAITM